jgi:hypothetical protein
MDVCNVPEAEQAKYAWCLKAARRMNVLRDLDLAWVNMCERRDRLDEWLDEFSLPHFLPAFQEKLNERAQLVLESEWILK